MNPQQLLTNTSNVVKVEQANKDLKKFITTLTLTGPIKRIFKKAEKRVERIHENAQKFRANHLFLDLETTIMGENWDEVARLKYYIIYDGKLLKNALKNNLDSAKKNIIKQCEEGVERILEALENTSL